MDVLKRYKSKRNAVTLVSDGMGIHIVKRFADLKDAERERAAYEKLRAAEICAPMLLLSDGYELAIEYIEGESFLELLERQESTGELNLAPWESLLDWIMLLNKKTGLVMTDCNLGNFIYGTDGKVYGVDFESCEAGSLTKEVGAVCAFVELYYPAETRLKRKVSDFLQTKYSSDMRIAKDEIERETARHRAEIIYRRSRKKGSGFSGIILAGGQSLRMGVCKALLPWNGKSLVEHQIDKMKAVGIDDIILSGFPTELPGTRCVPDLFPGKGPLSGIHAGLLAANNPCCLVLGIDIPLVPLRTLSGLMCAHLDRPDAVTVLSHDGKLEPVIGIYNRSAAAAAEEILASDETSVRRLLDRTGYLCFYDEQDESLFCDCNTPEEYSEAYKSSKS